MRCGTEQWRPGSGLGCAALAGRRGAGPAAAKRGEWSGGREQRQGRAGAEQAVAWSDSQLHFLRELPAHPACSSCGQAHASRQLQRAQEQLGAAVIDSDIDSNDTSSSVGRVRGLDYSSARRGNSSRRQGTAHVQLRVQAKAQAERASGANSGGKKGGVDSCTLKEHAHPKTSDGNAPQKAVQLLVRWGGRWPSALSGQPRPILLRRCHLRDRC